MMIISGSTHDLGGGFVVRRLLPYRKKRMVGPFTFLDHMGPVEFAPNSVTDIRPHPHIGLSTLSYLFEGRMVHRDHLGNMQTILPGEVNWMTAGRGVVHSERAHAEDYGKKVRMEGLQFWVALPDETEDQAPSFRHYAKSELPIFKGEGFTATVVTGSAWGLTSPVQVSSPSFFLDVRADGAATVAFQPKQPSFETALYVLKGSVSCGSPDPVTAIESNSVAAGSLAFFDPASELSFQAGPGAHFVLIGGEPFKTPRFMSWNFVASSKAKLETARKAWAKTTWDEEKFPLIPLDDQERIPLDD